MAQGKPNLATRQRHTLELFDDVFELNSVALEILAAGRHIVEKVAHGKVGTLGRRHLGNARLLGRGKSDFTARLVFFPAGTEGHLRNGRDAGQGLSPETEGQNLVQIFRFRDFAGRVPLETKHGIIGRHSATIVHHPDQGSAPVHDGDVNPVGSGIHGIFHQLLDHRGGTLYHLAGRNHIGQVARKNFNVHTL